VREQKQSSERSEQPSASCARRGLSQENLGFAGDLHRNYVGAIERGEINPTLRILLKVCHGLAIPLSELTAVYERQLHDRARVAVAPDQRHARCHTCTQCI
jgi:transcriptional regulator with XRE-family HTH domain